LTITFNSAKRYERMMRAHGIAPNAATIRPAPNRAPKNERRESGGSSNKKRKADQFLEDTPADDDEGYGPGHITLKPDPTDVKEEFVVKEELEPQQQGQMHLAQAANLIPYYDDNSSQYGVSQIGGDDVFGTNEYGGGMSGYATPTGYGTPMGAAFGSQSSNNYYANPFGTVGMSDVPRSQQLGFQYAPALQYQPDDRGRSESPVIVE
jgi:hypothetical protein